MKAAEFRQLSKKDLQDKITSLQENLLRLRCNRILGQLEDKTAIKKARTDIARGFTIMKEKTDSMLTNKK
ncbi:MAG: 50S ribosomal protein L29 [Deltaproteobacteria bacterium]|nr:50S ribosomal protein L29 [Deltaproteobacteria bacterium]